MENDDKSHRGEVTYGNHVVSSPNSEHKETHISDKVLNIIENENITGGKLDSEFTDRSAFGIKASFNL